MQIDDPKDKIQVEENNVVEKDDAAPNVEENSEEEEQQALGEENTEEQEVEEEVPAKEPWQKKRIDKLTARLKALEDENKKLKTRPVEDKETYTKAELDEIVKNKSAQAAEEALTTAEMRVHNRAVDRIVTKAEKEDAKFKENLASLLAVHEEGLPFHIQQAIVDLDEDAAKVLAHVVSDEDIVDRLIGLSPTKVAIELAKIANKLEKKPASKPVSKAPPPAPQVTGPSARSGAVLSDNMSTEDWVATRNKQRAEHFKQRGY